MYETSSGEVLKSDGEGNRSLSTDENLIVYKHPCGTLSKLYLPVCCCALLNLIRLYICPFLLLFMYGTHIYL